MSNKNQNAYGLVRRILQVAKEVLRLALLVLKFLNELRDILD
jgi:hypothetical protein